MAAVVSTSCATASLTSGPGPDDLASAAGPLDAAVTQMATLEAAAPAAPADVAIAPPPEAMEGETALRPPPAKLAARPQGTAAGTWAVIIGVDDYPGVKYDLRSAVNDAHDMDRALAGMGVPGENRLVLTDGQVTRGTIRNAVEWLTARAGPDAVAVFFFAGHVRKLSATTEAMIGADGRAVSDAELAASLRPLAARRAWVGIAACYGGGFTEVLAPGRVLTGAAPADEPAYENSEFSRSYMVEFMVRQAMIEGRAPETVQSAFAYARDALAQKYPNRQPVQFDHGGGALDLRQPGMPAPQRKPSPAPQQPSTRTTPTTAAPPKSGDDGGDDEKKCTGLGTLFGC
ncbi:MAG TPA: caspase family protein [Acidimicrobiales bacterium]|nr:caspase family protein [Acidimicrobiales bacterium]